VSRNGTEMHRTPRPAKVTNLERKRAKELARGRPQRGSGIGSALQDEIVGWVQCPAAHTGSPRLSCLLSSKNQVHLS